MAAFLAIFVGCSFLGGIFAGVAWLCAGRLFPEEQRPQTFRWMLGWSIKGFVVPLLIWGLMNLGLSWDLHAFMPLIQQAQANGKKWLPAFLQYFGEGMFIVGTFWMAISVAWMLLRLRPTLEKERRTSFNILCGTCFLALSLPAAGFIYLGGWPLAGLACGVVLLPIAAYAPEIARPLKRSPMYSRAVAKMKFGKYAEAEWEIISELEKFQDDFDGWMMMAQLYAEHFHDLREAEQTILDITDQPKITPSQISVALHKLADWYLKLGADPDGARRCLQMVCDRCRGSHLARMAQLRLNQLPHSARELQDQQTARPIPLLALGDRLDESEAGETSVVERRRAADSARDCVRMLEQDPNYVPAREKLARLLAEQLDKPDQGIDQLKLLFEMEDQPPGRRAEWLSLIASWHIKYRKDPEKGHQLLARVVREFPNTPQALAAAHRLRVKEVAQQAPVVVPPKPVIRVEV